MVKYWPGERWSPPFLLNSNPIPQQVPNWHSGNKISILWKRSIFSSESCLNGMLLALLLSNTVLCSLCISFVLTEFSHYFYSDRSGTGVGDENRMPHLYPDALDTVCMDDLIKDYLSSKDNVWSLCTQKTTQHWLAQGFMQVFCTFFCAFLVVKTPKGKMCLVLIVKPWTNGLTSEHKFLTCIQLCFMWPTACLDLQWLVLTLAEFRFMCNSMHDFQHLATQHK